MMSSRLKVVVVDWDISYPANSGKRLRTLNLMLQLADRHDVTYFSRGDGGTAEGRKAQQFLQSHGIKTEFANAPLPTKSTVAYYGRLAANLYATQPLAVTAHRSSKFARALRDYARDHDVDLWQLEWTPYVDMVQGIRASRTLINAHNVDSLLWQRYEESEPNLLRRRLFMSQRRKFERFERAAFNRATAVVAVSDDDAAIIRRRFGAPRVHVVDNGVDVAHYQAVTAARDPYELLFLGSMDWRPNLDGVRLLLDDILPRVWQREPAARLTIVGRKPPEWLIALCQRTPQVELHANVPDVRPYLARAGQMVVPLRMGGGSRLKILEALANGLPVVATNVAAEGLRLTPGHDVQIADDFEDMAAVVVRGIRRPSDAEAIARRGLRLVEDQYCWKRLADELEAIWEQTVATRIAKVERCST